MVGHDSLTLLHEKQPSDPRPRTPEPTESNEGKIKPDPKPTKFASLLAGEILTTLENVLHREIGKPPISVDEAEKQLTDLVEGLDAGLLGAKTLPDDSDKENAPKLDPSDLQVTPLAKILVEKAVVSVASKLGVEVPPEQQVTVAPVHIPARKNVGNLKSLKPSSDKTPATALMLAILEAAAKQTGTPFHTPASDPGTEAKQPQPPSARKASQEKAKSTYGGPKPGKSTSNGKPVAGKSSGTAKKSVSWKSQPSGPPSQRSSRESKPPSQRSSKDSSRENRLPKETKSRENKPPSQRTSKENKPPSEKGSKETKPPSQRGSMETKPPSEQSSKETKPPSEKSSKETKAPSEKVSQQTKPPSEKGSNENKAPIGTSSRETGQPSLKPSEPSGSKEKSAKPVMPDASSGKDSPMNKSRNSSNTTPDLRKQGIAKVTASLGHPDEKQDEKRLIEESTRRVSSPDVRDHIMMMPDSMNTGDATQTTAVDEKPPSAENVGDQTDVKEGQHANQTVEKRADFQKPRPATTGGKDSKPIEGKADSKDGVQTKRKSSIFDRVSNLFSRLSSSTEKVKSTEREVPAAVQEKPVVEVVEKDIDARPEMHEISTEAAPSTVDICVGTGPSMEALQKSGTSENVQEEKVMVGKDAYKSEDADVDNQQDTNEIKEEASEEKADVSMVPADDEKSAEASKTDVENQQHEIKVDISEDQIVSSMPIPKVKKSEGVTETSEEDKVTKEQQAPKAAAAKKDDGKDKSKTEVRKKEGKAPPKATSKERQTTRTEAKAPPKATSKEKQTGKADGKAPPKATSKEKQTGKATSKEKAPPKAVSKEKQADKKEGEMPPKATSKEKQTDKSKGKAPLNVTSKEKQTAGAEGKAPPKAISKEKHTDKTYEKTPSKAKSKERQTEKAEGKSPPKTMSKEEQTDKTEEKAPSKDTSKEKQTDKAEGKAPSKAISEEKETENVEGEALPTGEQTGQVEEKASSKTISQEKQAAEIEGLAPPKATSKEKQNSKEEGETPSKVTSKEKQADESKEEAPSKTTSKERPSENVQGKSPSEASSKEKQIGKMQESVSKTDSETTKACQVEAEPLKEKSSTACQAGTEPINEEEKLLDTNTSDSAQPGEPGNKDADAPAVKQNVEVVKDAVDKVTEGEKTLVKETPTEETVTTKSASKEEKIGVEKKESVKSKTSLKHTASKASQKSGDTKIVEDEKQQKTTKKQASQASVKSAKGNNDETSEKDLNVKESQTMQLEAKRIESATKEPPKKPGSQAMLTETTAEIAKASSMPIEQKAFATKGDIAPPSNVDEANPQDAQADEGVKSDGVDKVRSEAESAKQDSKPAKSGSHSDKPDVGPTKTSSATISPDTESAKPDNGAAKANLEPVTESQKVKSKTSSNRLDAQTAKSVTEKVKSRTSSDRQDAKTAKSATEKVKSKTSSDKLDAKTAKSATEKVKSKTSSDRQDAKTAKSATEKVKSKTGSDRQDAKTAKSATEKVKSKTSSDTQDAKTAKSATEKVKSKTSSDSQDAKTAKSATEKVKSKTSSDRQDAKTAKSATEKVKSKTSSDTQDAKTAKLATEKVKSKTSLDMLDAEIAKSFSEVKELTDRLANAVKSDDKSGKADVAETKSDVEEVKEDDEPSAEECKSEPEQSKTDDATEKQKEVMDSKDTKEKAECVKENSEGTSSKSKVQNIEIEEEMSVFSAKDSQPEGDSTKDEHKDIDSAIQQTPKPEQTANKTEKDAISKQADDKTDEKEVDDKKVTEEWKKGEKVKTTEKADEAEEVQKVETDLTSSDAQPEKLVKEKETDQEKAEGEESKEKPVDSKKESTEHASDTKKSKSSSSSKSKRSFLSIFSRSRSKTKEQPEKQESAKQTGSDSGVKQVKSNESKQPDDDKVLAASEAGETQSITTAEVSKKVSLPEDIVKRTSSPELSRTPLPSGASVHSMKSGSKASGIKTHERTSCDKMPVTDLNAVQSDKVLPKAEAAGKAEKPQVFASSPDLPAGEGEAQSKRESVHSKPRSVGSPERLKSGEIYMYDPAAEGAKKDASEGAVIKERPPSSRHIAVYMPDPSQETNQLAAPEVTPESKISSSSKTKTEEDEVVKVTDIIRKESDEEVKGAKKISSTKIEIKKSGAKKVASKSSKEELKKTKSKSSQRGLKVVETAPLAAKRSSETKLTPSSELKQTSSVKFSQTKVKGSSLSLTEKHSVVSIDNKTSVSAGTLASVRMLVQDQIEAARQVVKEEAEKMKADSKLVKVDSSGPDAKVKKTKSAPTNEDSKGDVIKKTSAQLGALKDIADDYKSMKSGTSVAEAKSNVSVRKITSAFKAIAKAYDSEIKLEQQVSKTSHTSVTSQPSKHSVEEEEPVGGTKQEPQKAESGVEEKATHEVQGKTIFPIHRLLHCLHLICFYMYKKLGQLSISNTSNAT